MVCLDSIAFNILNPEFSDKLTIIIQSSFIVRSYSLKQDEFKEYISACNEQYIVCTIMNGREKYFVTTKHDNAIF